MPKSKLKSQLVQAKLYGVFEPIKTTYAVLCHLFSMDTELESVGQAKVQVTLCSWRRL